MRGGLGNIIIFNNNNNLYNNFSKTRPYPTQQPIVFLLKPCDRIRATFVAVLKKIVRYFSGQSFINPHFTSEPK